MLVQLKRVGFQTLRSDRTRGAVIELACGFACKASTAGHVCVMGIGAGIFLIALGAVLAFAVNWTLAGLDLHAVGWILMVTGVAGLFLFFYFWNRRRTPAPVVRQTQVRADPATYYDPTIPAPAPVAAPAPVTVAVPAPVVVETPVAAPAPVVASVPVAPPPARQRTD